MQNENSAPDTTQIAGLSKVVEKKKGPAAPGLKKSGGSLAAFFQQGAVEHAAENAADNRHHPE
ncbi:hypothetical protein DZK29_24420 [Klebsiella michiganensis]|nr:hypothetical protein DZK29_24420 [Klebsiella michiganensis]RMC81373.1 hypothetical protein EBH72_25645 [Klebsiella michiganensis]TXV04692.1 hypothetical protein D4M92_15830 [Klebsiella michiganensis]